MSANVTARITHYNLQSLPRPCDAHLSLPPRGHGNTEPSFSILNSHDLELLCPKVAAGLKVVCLKVLGQTGFEFALVSCA